MSTLKVGAVLLALSMGVNFWALEQMRDWEAPVPAITIRTPAPVVDTFVTVTPASTSSVIYKCTMGAIALGPGQFYYESTTSTSPSFSGAGIDKTILSHKP